MMLSPFVWGRNGEALTPDQVAALRELADAQRGKMGDTSPVGHWSAGAARVVDALGGVLKERRADKAEAAGMASADDAISGNTVLSALIGGGSAQPGNAMAPGTLQAASDNPYRDAIASIESDGSGGYAAIGPTHPKMGRALGRYQIMEANLPGWSQAALGRPVSADEFMANPDIQDAIFDHQFGGYVEKYGPEGAAQAWLGGPGGVGQVDRKDSLGTSIGDYGARFTKALGGSYGQPPQQDAGVIAALAKAAADPWVQQKYGPVIDALMGNEMKRQNALYEQQLAQSDPAYQLGLQKSQLELDALRNPPAPKPIEVGGVLLDPVTMEPLFDSRTPADGGFTLSPGQTRYDGTGQPIASGAPVDAPRPMTAEDRAAWGIPPDDARPYAMVDGKPALIGGNGVTVNNNMGDDKFGEAFAKGDAATLGAVGDAGLAAQRNIARIDQLEVLLGQSPTGFSGLAAQKAGEWGIPTEGLDSIQAAQALINSLVPEQRPAGSGPMSDADLELFKQSLPRIINQPGGNKAIIDTMRGIARYDAEGATIVQKLRAGEISRADAFAALQSRQNPLAGFKAPAGAPEAAAAPPAVDAIDPAYQAFITDPNIIAAAKKYGVTPDEMWATKNGGGQ